MGMLETRYEKNHVDEVECGGGKSLKWVCKGRTGYPDRIDLFPIYNKKHIEIVARYIRFSEIKTSVGSLQENQKRRHKELNEMGFNIKVRT